MSKFELMNDEEVIKCMKNRIAMICIGIITLVLLLYSKIIDCLNPYLSKYFFVIAIIVYLISVLSIKFFLNKVIFNMDSKSKSQMAKSIRSKYKK